MLPPASILQGCDVVYFQAETGHKQGKLRVEEVLRIGAAIWGGKLEPRKLRKHTRSKHNVPSLRDERVEVEYQAHFVDENDSKKWRNALTYLHLWLRPRVLVSLNTASVTALENG